MGGILAIAQTLGVVGGTGIASATGSIAAGYLATAAVLVALALPYCFNSRDHALPRRLREPFEVRRFLRAFWISPRAHPDFAWAWLTRFLMNLGNALGLLYLLYFMQDAVDHTVRGGRARGVRADRYLRRVAGPDHRPRRHLDRPDGRRKVFVISPAWCGRRCCCSPLVRTWPGASSARSAGSGSASTPRSTSR